MAGLATTMNNNGTAPESEQQTASAPHTSINVPAPANTPATSSKGTSSRDSSRNKPQRKTSHRRGMTKAQKTEAAQNRAAKRSGFERGSRSFIMSRIRGTDTSIETLTRSYLFARGLRFRKNDKRYPGHPDIVLPKWHTMVFINGCFWHMHDCGNCTIPKSHVEFWTAKLERNKARDARQHAQLRAQGWRVIVVWECELKTVQARAERLERLYRQITDGNDTKQPDSTEQSNSTGQPNSTGQSE